MIRWRTIWPLALAALLVGAVWVVRHAYPLQVPDVHASLRTPAATNSSSSAPAASSSQLPSAPQPTGLPERLRRAFDLLDQRRIQYLKRDDILVHDYQRFLRPMRHFREKRLLVLGFPEEALLYYGPRALAATLNSEERREAILAISILAELGREDVRGVVIKLSRDKSPDIREDDYKLLPYYRDARTASVLFQEVEEGRRSALWELALFFDSDSVRGHALQLPLEPQTDDERLFRERVSYFTDLMDPKRLRECLLDLEQPYWKGPVHAPEFLQYAAYANRTDLVPLLRERADQLFKKEAGITPQELVERALDPNAKIPQELSIYGSSYEELFQEFIDANVYTGATYEETLVAIARLGGELTDWEKALLRRFGFYGDRCKEAEAVIDQLGLDSQK